MGRYGRIDSIESCVETRKSKKFRLAQEELKLKDFIKLTDHMDVPWEARAQTVGGAYLAICRLKKDLRRTKTKKDKK